MQVGLLTLKGSPRIVSFSNLKAFWREIHLKHARYLVLQMTDSFDWSKCFYVVAETAASEVNFFINIDRLVSSIFNNYFFSVCRQKRHLQSVEPPAIFKQTPFCENQNSL